MAELTGYPVPFFSPSENLGSFREQFIPSAVERTLRGTDVRALVGHDPLKPLARQSAGTLMLRREARGLFARVEMPNTTYARDLMEVVRTGAAPGWSFGFRTLLDSWEMEADGVPLRSVLDCVIAEISCGVVWPAYTATETLRAHAGGARALRRSGPQDETRATADRVAAFVREVARDHPGHTVVVSCAYRAAGPKMRVLSVRRRPTPMSVNRARHRLAGVGWSYQPTRRN